MADAPSFDAKLARIEGLTMVLERSRDLEARAASRELVGTLLELHAAGLSKILGWVDEAGEAGLPIASSMALDDLVAGLLLLHGLHPDDLEARVRHALDDLRARLGAQGRGIELVGLRGGTLTLRLSGESGGCPSTSGRLRKSIEDALLAAAPDLAIVAFEETHAAPSGLPSLPIISF